MYENKVQRVPFQGHSPMSVEKKVIPKSNCGFLHTSNIEIIKYKIEVIPTRKRKPPKISLSIFNVNSHLVGWSKGGQRSPANLPNPGFKEVPGQGRQI